MPDMTAFDLFQEATVHIASGDRPKARRVLDRAIRKIDRDGTDAFIRPDLAKLRDSLAS